ncbi:DNA-binding transcriptional regulator, LacI/PurR family [Ruminococcus sp. YE71]|uniref:substrate-binding domain-containing protein n=1 Tax=unclassified Ruminococcus TaxID=2608920 RepID=UPI00087F8D6C|nr:MULTISPECIES: substrate-binding domain-containing protein [unclassified Ruminococcus]SDA11202.1 DNA-binding transcriptional regulator, LacI/PurR family [Ruminococcus sp. YE78]SFW14923.1 DNA-binding transcriptional regulator, LacI/PurR family [Ruminococcus sp. YE71]
MNTDHRPLIGVITARASQSEQRQLLKGILSKADELGIDIAVFSNVYNFAEYFADVEVENKIYELVHSERLDGLILAYESLIYPDLIDSIHDHIRELNIPIVVADAKDEGFTCINTDVKRDFRCIARHLTDVHGIRDIDIITGYEAYETSHLRVDGVREIMEERGLPFGEKNVIFGNFWNNSGEKLAEDYISGKRRLPQAVICANDYMAFGLLDKLFNNDLTPPDDLTVIGYEHIGERIYHSPILTTYQRNRMAIGAKAVALIYSKLTGAPMQDIDTSGYMITGDTCSCGVEKKYLREELLEIQQTKAYNDMNFCGNFEQQSVTSRSISDYIHTLQEFSYLIRNVSGIYLCLHEDWCTRSQKSSVNEFSNNEPMICYRVISPEKGSDEPAFFTRGKLFPAELPGAGDKKFLFFTPLFSEGKEFGHFIFQYTTPDTYDSVMIEWLKITVNALQVLRMKNDINTLLECSNLSEFHDTATGLYNKQGFTSELVNACKKLGEDGKIPVIMIRTGIYSDDSRIDKKNLSVRLDMEIAECLNQIAGSIGGFCGKLSDKQYIVAASSKFTEEKVPLIMDKLEIIISHSPLYIQERGLDTLFMARGEVSADRNINECIAALSEDINMKIKQLSEERHHAYYKDYLQVRNSMYRDPGKEWDAQMTCRDFHLSYGHFRATYKDIFGISFHQDLIMSRIAMAKYLLLTTNIGISAVSFKCGYTDEKYFMRQFRQTTGVTPNSYRNNLF